MNGNRFSIPAARNQNYRQIRSAGSPIVTTNLQIYGIGIWQKEDEEYISKLSSVTQFAGLGGGYGYNWVPSSKWLIHMLITEDFGFLNKVSNDIGGEAESFTGAVPIFATNACLAVYYFFGNWHTGFCGSSEDVWRVASSNSAFTMNRLTYNIFVILGVRF